MMDVANGGIRSFSNSMCFVNEIIYLPSCAFAHTTENTTFSRGLKIYGPWLHQVAWNMDLLGIIERIVNCTIEGAWIMTLIVTYAIQTQKHTLANRVRLIVEITARTPISFIANVIDSSEGLDIGQNNQVQLCAC